MSLAVKAFCDKSPEGVIGFFSCLKSHSFSGINGLGMRRGGRGGRGGRGRRGRRGGAMGGGPTSEDVSVSFQKRILFACF